MFWQVIPYTVTLLLAAFVSIVVVFFALRVRFPSGTRSSFIIFMSGVTIWSVCYAFEVASATLPAKLFWANLQYVGVLVMPPALLFFHLYYTNQERWINLNLKILFAVVTLLIFLLVWTDQSHHLLRENLALAQDPIPELVFDQGPLFRIIALYFYLVLFLSTVALVRSILQSTQYYRGQAFALLSAIFIPWGASVLELAQIDLIPHLSPVVFSFILTGGIYVWAFWRYRLLDILPVAQRAIFEHLPDGIIVLDNHLRVNNLNPAASKMLSVQEKEIIGTSILETLPDFKDIIRYRKMAEIRLQNIYDSYYEVLVSELFFQPGKSGGFLLVMREITQRKRIEIALRQSELQYRNVSERANDGIAILQDNVIKYVNPQLRDMLGFAPGEMVEQPFLDFISESEREMAYRQYEGRMAGREIPSRYEIALRKKSGEDLPVEINASLTEFAARRADLIFVRDISAQKRSREQMATKNQELAAAVESANQMKEVAEKRAQELQTLQEATQIVSSFLNQEEAIQRILEQIARVVPYDSAAVQLWREDHLEIVGCRGFPCQEEINGLHFPLEDSNPGAIVFRTGKPLILADVQQEFPQFRNPKHSHIRGWMGVPLILKNITKGIISLDSKEPDHFNGGQARLASVFANQVSIALENAHLFEEVTRLSITDPLTGLFNRRHFYEMTLHEYERYVRYGTPFSVLMLDADHFKQINDTYGHLAGDKVLETLADLFRANLRKVDILCRFGGEEFIATLPETRAREAACLAERLRDQINKCVVQTDAGPVTVTVSIGIAEFDRGCDTIDRLLDCADKALYQAKMDGRNKVSVFLEENSA